MDDPCHTAALSSLRWETNRSGLAPRLYSTPAGSSMVGLLSDNATAILNNSGGLPNDPALENATNAGGALQYIVTVNSTNFTWNGQTSQVPTLDLLLAALLDNTTGGVNGTLVNITSTSYEIGLPAPVLSAIPNATQVYTGFFGPPTKPAVSPPSHSSCSSWGCVTEWGLDLVEWTLKGEQYFFSLDWMGTLAHFFETLPSAVERFGLFLINCAGNPLDCAAQTLAEAAAAAAKLAAELAQWIATELTKFIDWLIQPPVNAVKHYFGSYDATMSFALNATIADVVDGGSYRGSVSELDAFRLLDSIGGSVMILSMILGAIATVACIVLSDVAIGPGLLFGILLTLFGIGAQAALPNLVGAAEFTNRLIWEMDNWTSNLTHTNTGQVPHADRTALAEGVGDGADFAQFPLDIYVGVKILSNPGAATVWPAVSLMFDLAGLAIDAEGWALHTLGLAIIGTAVSSLGLLVSLKPGVQLSGGLILLDRISGLLGVVSLGASVAGLGADL